MAYIFDTSRGETPETIKRRRAIVDMLRGRTAKRSADTVGEGVGNALESIGYGVAARMEEKRANRAESEGMAGANSLFDSIVSGITGGSMGGFPAAPAQPSSIGPAAGSPAGGSRAASEIQQPAPDIPADVAGLESYIRQAAQKRGIDPDIAVRVARSEGLAPGVWQSNVVKNGRRETSYGPFQLLVGGGLGDKFMKLYGKSPADRSTVLQQIDFALDEAATGGWSPWYGAAKVGVGPRTGLDNARPLGMQAAAAPVQVASLDPSAGMAAAAAPAADTMQPGQPVTQTAAGNRILRALLTPGPMADQAAPMTLGAPEPQPVQVAQAQPQVIPPMAGGPAPAMQRTGPSLQQLLQAAQNPWLNENQRAVVNMLLEQELQKNDPMRQLQLEKQRLEIEALRNPQPKPTDDIREYEFARSQGYQGTFQQFMTEMKRAGAISVDARQMGNIPPGYQVQYDDQGRPVSMVPIPGSPADIEARQAAEEADSRLRVQTLSDADKADTTLDATQSVLDILDNAETPATGTLSRPFALYSGTPAGKVRSYVSTLQSGVALGAMQRLKEASATGATGFGSLSTPELNLLISDIGALDPDTTEPEIFRKTVQRIHDRAKRVAEDIVKNVSPERIQELGLQPFIDGFLQRKNKARVIDGYTIEQVD